MLRRLTPPPYRELAAAKERELHELYEAEISRLQEVLFENTKETSSIKEAFRKLQDDFMYNLSLLKGRDQDLSALEETVTTLNAAVGDRETRLKELKTTLDVRMLEIEDLHVLERVRGDKHREDLLIMRRECEEECKRYEESERHRKEEERVYRQQLEEKLKRTELELKEVSMHAAARIDVLNKEHVEEMIILREQADDRTAMSAVTERALRAELTAAQLISESSERRREEFAVLVRDLEKKLREIQREKEDMRNVLAARVAELEETLNKVRSDGAKTISELEQEKAVAQEVAENREKAFRCDMSDLQQSIANALADAEAANRREVKQKEEYEKLSKKTENSLHKLFQEKEKLQKMVRDLTEENHLMKVNNDGESKQLQDSLSGLEKELGDLQSQIVEYQREIAIRHQVETELRLEVKKINTQMEENREKSWNRRKEWKAQKDRIQSLLSERNAAELRYKLLESRLKDKTLPHGDSQSLGEQGFTNVINLNHATPDIHRRNSILDKNVPTNNGVHAIDGGENAQPLPMNDRTDNDSSGASEPRQIDGGENDVEMMKMKVEKAVEENNTLREVVHHMRNEMERLLNEQATQRDGCREECSQDPAAANTEIQNLMLELDQRKGDLRDARLLIDEKQHMIDRLLINLKGMSQPLVREETTQPKLLESQTISQPRHPSIPDHPDHPSSRMASVAERQGNPREAEVVAENNSAGSDAEKRRFIETLRFQLGRAVADLKRVATERSKLMQSGNALRAEIRFLKEGNAGRKVNKEVQTSWNEAQHLEAKLLETTTLQPSHRITPSQRSAKLRLEALKKTKKQNEEDTSPVQTTIFEEERRTHRGREALISKGIRNWNWKD